MIRTFVKRVWGAIVLCSILTGVGLVSFSKLDWAMSTQATENEIYISTNSKALITLDEMMKYTKKLEKQIKSIQGVQSFNSSTTSQKIDIEINVKSGNSLENVLLDLREKLISINKPDNIAFPKISRTNKRNSPIIKLDTYSKNLSLREITEYARNILSGEIERISGVAYVEINGVSKPEISIQILPEKLAHYNISNNDFHRAFKTYNSDSNMAHEKTITKEFDSSSESNIKTLESIKNMIINYEKNIRIRDVAEVFFKDKESQEEWWINGTQRALNLKVFKTTEGNPLNISNEVKNILKKWQEKHNLVMDITDNAEDIRVFLSKTKKAFIEAIVIVLVIILFFLGSLKACITPILAIPISLISTFTVLKVFSCSLNVSTLMGFLLAVGLVVDDAIIVVENIISFYKIKKSWYEAAIAGTEDIKMPIIAMTLTLVFVFLPVIGIGGDFGSTLKEFAITLSASVVISGIVSLVLTPMVGARILAHSHFADMVLDPLEKGYEFLLKRVLRFSYIFVLFGLTLLGSAIYMAKNLPIETFPSGSKLSFEINTVSVKNKNLDFLKSNGVKIVKFIEKQPWIDKFYLKLKNGLHLEVHIKEKYAKEKKKIQEDTMNEIQKIVKDMRFVSRNTSDEENFNIYIYGNVSRDEINKIGGGFYSDLHSCPGVDNVTTYSVSNLSLDINVDYDKASLLNTDVGHLEDILKTVGSRTHMSYLKTANGNKYKIVISSDPKLSINDKIKYIWKNDSRRTHVSPNVFTQMSYKNKTNQYINFNGANAYILCISKDSNYKIGQVIDNINKIFNNGYSNKVELSYTGDAQKFLEESNQMLYMFVYSVLFILAILLAQFESLKSAIAVLSTAPLALFGAILAIRGGTLNIFSTIGLITLIGLIIKHGILFVNSANKNLENGGLLTTAVINASRSRLRAVLMTTFAMVLGLIPLLYERHNSMIRCYEMARVLVPGLCFGTLMTLFIVPSLYMILFKNSKN
jgi:multidrug efflux pump